MSIYPEQYSPVFNPIKDLNIERILDGVSLATTQFPTGLGEVNSLQIEFGAGVVTPQASLSSLGAITINETGTYRVKISLIFGRTSNPNTSRLRFRALVNGVQAGLTIGATVPNANSSTPYTDEAWLSLPAGTVITYEVMRDSSGSDEGGLVLPTVTAATAPSWNQAATAAIRIERWK
mgnify:CR=1|tara:strand:+ start:7907 stop:8440 length:534 start_codon:yes stop_codon:yes gene_type:complete